MQNCRFSVVIERDKEGYFAFCFELQGCYTQRDSYEEVSENIRDAIRLHVQDRLWEEIPQFDSIGRVVLVEEAEMKSTVLEAFLLGVTFGIGITILALYTQKPSHLVTSIETMAEMGRTRRAKEEEKKVQRERLKTVGFSDEEIDEFFQ